MKRLLLILLVVVLAGVIGAGLWVRQRVTAPFASFSGEQFIEIPQGESTAGIGRRLVEAGVIRDPLTFRLAVRWYARGRSL